MCMYTIGILVVTKWHTNSHMAQIGLLTLLQLQKVKKSKSQILLIIHKSIMICSVIMILHSECQ